MPAIGFPCQSEQYQQPGLAQPRLVIEPFPEGQFLLHDTGLVGTAYFAHDFRARVLWTDGIRAHDLREHDL